MMNSHGISVCAMANMGIVSGIILRRIGSLLGENVCVVGNQEVVVR